MVKNGLNVTIMKTPQADGTCKIFGRVLNRPYASYTRNVTF